MSTTILVLISLLTGEVLEEQTFTYAIDAFEAGFEAEQADPTVKAIVYSA